jgi:sodium/potassium-transporting ATPase subunit alpha
VWGRCKYIDVNGEPTPITEEWKQKFDEVNKGFGSRGERVLGFAKYHLPKDRYPRGYKFNVNIDSEKLLEQGLCFVGVLSLSDPPRDTVPYAVLKCRSAGVKVIMVTGDQPTTAASIARLCNIITEDETVNEVAERTGKSKEECFDKSAAIVVHGDDITQMSIEDEGLP